MLHAVPLGLLDYSSLLPMFRKRSKDKNKPLLVVSNFVRFICIFACKATLRGWHSDHFPSTDEETEAQ